MFKNQNYQIEDLLARSHAIISSMLTKTEVSLLLSARDLKELQALLLQTHFSKALINIDLSVQLSQGAKNLKEFYVSLIESFYKQATSENVKAKILQFTLRYHVSNIRQILHGKYQGTSKEDILSQIVATPNYRYHYYENLLDLSIEEIINRIDVPDFRRVLIKAYIEFEASHKFTPIEATIDHYLYKTLLELSPYYEEYVNFQNILALCRCLYRNVLPYQYLIPSKFIAKGLKATSVHEVLEIYNYGIYGKVFGKYLSEEEIPLHDLEFAVEKYQLDVWRKVYRSNELSTIDELIAFFEIKLAEVMDVIRIMVGINAELPRKEIAESLLLYKVKL